MNRFKKYFHIISLGLISISSVSLLATSCGTRDTNKNDELKIIQMVFKPNELVFLLANQSCYWQEDYGKQWTGERSFSILADSNYKVYFCLKQDHSDSKLAYQSIYE
jgi:hypothetical protein